MIDQEYLAKLKANMADPGHAVTKVCSLCGHVDMLRAWPGPGPDGALDAFLDGLAGLAQRTGNMVYGFWMLAGNALPPEGPQPDTPCQLWRANDRELVAESTMLEVTKLSGGHECRSLN